MNLQKLNPWNWFKHEESSASSGTVPIRREDSTSLLHRDEWSHPLMQLHQRIDHLFDDVFRSFDPPYLSGVFRPNVDVSCNSENYSIALELPGLEKSDISIELKDDRLVISGEKQEQSKSEERHYYRIESRYGKFQRVLALPEDADPDGISAEMKQGILTLTIRRKAISTSDVKRISVQ